MALFEKIVEWLSDINYHAIQADNYGKRAEGTGEWAFDDPKIVDWMGGSLGVLWGVGMPGAGKTVLASIIINHLLQKAKANKRIFVAFAFSRYTDQFTGDKVLGGLLRQVVQDHPSTLAFVKPMYDYHHQRKTRPSQKELLDVIRAIFNSDLFDEKFCALDGLDEAFEDTQVDVLDALASLPANLLLMSRPLPLLKDRVPDALFIDIILHEADIIQMIENKIGHMPRLHNLLEKGDWKKKVVKTVLDKSTGMFLLASLQLDMLGSCINIKSLNTALQVLPEGVNAMYEVTMERINSGLAPKLALGALTLLAYACESLKMDDLLHALAVETEPFKYDSNLLVDSDTVLSACCGLITFEPETKLVRLVHYTAQDFLVTHLSKVGVNAEAVLACTCVARLQSCGFANYNGSIDDYDDNIFTYHPFLAYAHRNWAIHAHSASLPAFVEEFILQCQHIPWKHPFYEDFNHLNPIQLAAACNFHSLLAQWLGLDPSLPTYQPPFPFNINSKSANGHTALALAAVCGHLKTVELLIEVEGVDTQCFDSRGWSPLIAASREGHVQVVDLLLGVVDADHVNAGSWTALMHAVFSGKTEVMKSLLCVQGIHVNAILPNTGCREGYSALIFAAGNGQLDAVRLLLEVDGIDVNASFSRCGTALVVATREEYTDIVKLLLQQEDINVNSSSQCTQGSALMQAAYWGYKDMVKLLLQQEEIDVNATRPDGHSALSLALKKIPCKPNKPRLEIAELLQAHGAQ
ncbi:ankyrin [Coprinopsis marcescibilis]|uniref:Ankyrin n=1 Tax=Coprinopsis marcescibilis TaxID=230819 RepID=A0A5C3KCM3_COPMA|nr:ankyrin [Coprinopsis marcescibilis]